MEQLHPKIGELAYLDNTVKPVLEGHLMEG